LLSQEKAVPSREGRNGPPECPRTGKEKKEAKPVQKETPLSIGPVAPGKNAHRLEKKGGSNRTWGKKIKKKVELLEESDLLARPVWKKGGHQNRATRKKKGGRFHKE